MTRAHSQFTPQVLRGRQAKFAMMKKTVPAENPEAYAAELDGWRRALVVALRSEVRASAKLDEGIKWGHLVYSAMGPVLLIRAEDQRVLFGFWRGKRLREIEPRLKPGGKYEMATLELREGDKIEPTVVRKLVRKAVALNKSVGDPTEAAKVGISPKTGRRLTRR